MSRVSRRAQGMNPPEKFCNECGWEKGTGHGPQCSRFSGTKSSPKKR